MLPWCTAVRIVRARGQPWPAALGVTRSGHLFSPSTVAHDQNVTSQHMIWAAEVC